MAHPRLWKLPFDAAHPLLIAADARMTRTDPAVDAVWELRPSQGDSAAFALQTRYGGRAGLVSLVPMWLVNGQTYFSAAHYAGPTTIRAFAPSLVQLQTRITPTLALLLDFWAMESRAVGGRFTLRNTGREPLTVRLDMLGVVGMDGQEMPTKVIFVPGERHALSLGVIRDLTPILMLDNGYAAADTGGSKLSASLSLAADERASVRFVCASASDPRTALSLARQWLMQAWGDTLDRVPLAAEDQPRIETGDAALDAAIAFAYTQVVQSFLHVPPHSDSPLIVPRRAVGRQARARLDPYSTYAAALAAAAAAPELAQGVVRGLLAGQKEDGWIDAAPRIGDRPTMLHVPILARLAWSIFQYTEDSDFLRDTLPGLRRFYTRWQQPDLDVDGDGAPEWQSSAQMGMMTRLGLASVRVHPRAVETPGMVALLLSEALSLREIAHYLREDALADALSADADRLRGVLESFWDAQQGRYTYRDRDTHRMTRTQVLLSDGEGDADHILALPLSPPERVIVLVEGGFDRSPNFTLVIEGETGGGQTREEVTSDAFEWETGRGFYTSQHVYVRLDRVRCEGLVRVYRVSAFTPDLTMEDADGLLPLWTPGLPAERASALRDNIRQRFLTSEGVSADAMTTDGGPRVVAALQTLLGEGMVETGALDEAVEVVRRAFSTPRSPTQADALPPLHLLLRVLGVRVISPSVVWTGGPYVWPTPVTVTHKGVVVRRSAEGTTITFPTGQVVTLPVDAPWQMLTAERASRSSDTNPPV